MSGSPPLVWGTQVVVAGLRSQLGITPTYVGNTRRCFDYIAVRKDHPHLRGEYEEQDQPINFTWGSPPPAWGIRSGLE